MAGDNSPPNYDMYINFDFLAGIGPFTPAHPNIDSQRRGNTSPIRPPLRDNAHRRVLMDLMFNPLDIIKRRPAADVAMASLSATVYDPLLACPQLAPDGTLAAWYSTTSGRPAVHAASLDGSAAHEHVPEPIITHRTRVFCWSYAGDSIWIQAGDRLYEVTIEDVVRRTVTPGESVHLLGCTTDGIVYGNWSREDATSGNLVCFDPETGTRTVLTDHGQGHHAVAITAEGTVAYLPRGPSRGTPDAASLPTVVRYADGDLVELDRRYAPIDWRDDDLLVHDMERDDNVGIRNAAGGIDWIGSGRPIGFFDGDAVLVLRDGDAILLPEERPLEVVDRPIEHAAVADRRVLVITASTDDDPPRAISWWDGDTAPLETPRFAVPPSFLDAPTPETYVDSTGDDRETSLMLPDETPAPCLVHLYGHVPEAGDFDRKFGRELRYMREQGYAVLLPAHGGSWGNSKRRHADYAAAAHWAAEQPWSNGETVALGHSSGGYDVLMQATQYPASWTTGVAWSNIVGRRAFYEQFEKDRAWIRERDEGGANRLEEMSPIWHVADVDIPLLLIQGAEEHFQPETRAFVDRARSHDADIAYFEPPRVGHWTRDLGIVVHVWNTIETYLDATLRSRRAGQHAGLQC